jgi:hypothetical protein
MTRRDYTRCCVVCLAERRVFDEQSLEVRVVGDGGYQIVLPICERHRRRANFGFLPVVIPEMAYEARWITKGERA